MESDKIEVEVWEMGKKDKIETQNEKFAEQD